MNKKLVLTSIISLLLFIFLVIDALYTGYLIDLDTSINSIITTIQISFIIIFSKAIGILFDTYSMLIISLIIAVYLWIKISRKDALFFGVIMLLQTAVIEVVKNIIHRARPINELVQETSPAFPSGHTTTAVVFFGLLTYLILKRTTSKKLKLTAVVTSITMILLISLSRLYLNVHWFTDILAGLSLGLFILTISIILRKV